MKRTYRESSNKANIDSNRMKDPSMNVITVTELKIQRNDNRLSRPEKKHEPLKRPAMLRGRSHEQTSRANTRGTTSFLSNSYNSLGGGDPTRIAAQNRAYSSHQPNQKPVSTACAPKVRPAMTSNVAHAKTNRTASNGPIRVPPVTEERGRGVPPTEGPTATGAQKIASNVSNRQHNRDERYSNNRYPGKDNSISRNTGYPASNKPSNSSLRGTSPSSKRNQSGLKSTTPADVAAATDAKRYVPKRSSSIGPNSRGNDPHGSRNTNANKSNKSQSQSTGDLNIVEKKSQQRRGQSHRTEDKPWLKKSTRAGQMSLPTIEIYTPEGRYGDKNSRNQANSNILPVDLTEDTVRQYDTRKENSHVSADERTAEMNADAKETARDSETFPPTRSQNFDGENMKNILYFSEVNEPEDKNHRKLRNKSKNLGKSEREVKYDVVQPDPEYLRSRRADSFDGAATRYIFSGGPKEECDSNNQFMNDSGDEDHDMMCDNSWEQSSTKTRVKFIRKGDKSMREIKNKTDEGDQLIALRANRTACLGGDGMRNTMCDDHLKPRKGKKDNFSKVGENLALIKEYNDESDEEDQLAALRANRNACLGGNSMRNAMCDDHLKPRKGKKDNFTKVGENVALLREYNNESDEEDQLAALRANRNACLGGDSMRHAMCDDHLKPRKGKKDNFFKVGENVALLTEYNDESDEEDQLAALRANRNACLGGDSMRHAMCDDHLKPRKGKKDNFSKVGENVALLREYIDESDEEDQLAALRANRNACLGGDSMRHAMCDDHLKPRKGKKDNFSKVGENVALLREYNNESDEEDQLAALRANRNACLGGDSMRHAMCDDHLKPRKGKKDNFSKVGENVALLREYNDESDEEDQLAALRANRNACLGGDSMRHAMCDDHLKPRKGKKDNFSKVGENITLIREYNDYLDEEDQLAALRANRNACLGGDSMRYAMCDDHLKPRKGKKDNFSKVGENIPVTKEYDDEEDQLAALRANRRACLGGDNIRNVMCDDQLKPRKGKRDNFSKVGENIISIRADNDVSEDEDQLATLRANRAACLGGESMKHVLYDDHLKVRAGKKDNFSKVGENIQLLVTENKEDSDEDQLATLRANRNNCLGGSSMKTLMSDDHLKPRRGRKDNFAKVGENIIRMTRKTEDNGEKNQLTTSRTDRTACSGGNSTKSNAHGKNVSNNFTEDTEEIMKSNRTANMSGSQMRNLLCSHNITPPSSRSKNRTPLKKSIRSSSISGISNLDPEEAMKTNRAASMGGCDMRNILYDQNASQPTSQNRETTQLNKSVRSSSVSGSFDMKTESHMNVTTNAGDSHMKNRMHDRNPSRSASRKIDRTSSNKSARSSSVSGISTEDADKAFKANRFANMGGANMKTLLYGNANSGTSNESPLKKSVRSSSVSETINGIEKEITTDRSANKVGDGRTRSPITPKPKIRSSARSGHNIDADEAMKTNRSRSMGGSNMRNLLHENIQQPPTSRSVSKTSNYSKDNANVTMSKNARPQRSSSTEGSAMKSLLYSGTPSPPASIATRKPPLKKSLRGSADNSRANRGPMKAIHSIKSDDSHINSRIYGEGQYQDPSAEYVDDSSSRRPISSRRSRSVGPLSVSEIQEENQEILRTNRYKGIGGNNMKNILYGGNTYGDETGKSDYKYNEWSNASESVNMNTTEIQEYNQEILRANRLKGIGGSNMKNILYGVTVDSYESDPNYECNRCDNPFMENSPRDNEEQRSHIDLLPEKRLSSRKGYESKSETPRYEAKPVIRHSAFEGDTMKNLLYGDYAPVTSTEPAYQCDDNYREISDGEAAIELQAQEEYPSCTSLHEDAAAEENITLEFFSVESPEEPVGVLIPYDVINQFAPECGGNIERTAVALKHGNLVDCTCRMKMKNQRGKHPCVRHIMPKDLQFYNEASEVLKIISSPFGEENDRKISAIENNLARKYPNYFNNFVQKFNRQLSEDYRAKEQQSKLGVITSYRKLLAEEDSLSRREKCQINKKENICGKMKNLEKDFRTACKTLKKDYPFLFVQLLQEYDFPSLALEKNVVEKNRMSLLEISQLGTQKLQEFEEMFTNQQYHE